MTAAQTSLYFREVGLWRKARIAAGLGASDSDRHTLHARALGFHKSSKHFTNLDLDKVLGALRAISRPADLNAQLRVEANEDERKAAALAKCEAACYQLYSLGDDRLRYPENRERYTAGVCRRINFCGPEDCTAAQLAKVLGALERSVRVARDRQDHDASKKEPVPAAGSYSADDQPW